MRPAMGVGCFSDLCPLYVSSAVLELPVSLILSEIPDPFDPDAENESDGDEPQTQDTDPQVVDAATLTDEEDVADDENNEDYASFQRAVYQAVLGHIFKDLAPMALHGEAVTCSDNVTRSVHPEIHIASMDAEEAARFLGVRSASALFPCPTGLIAKSDLHDLTKTCKPRTMEETLKVLARASQADTKSEAEAILKSSGLHNSKVGMVYCDSMSAS